jgi:Kef-type K+ transport system membrane component KefB
MDFILHSAFAEVATLLMLAAVTGAVGLLLRQPLIVSFIAVGIIAGPSVLDIVHAEAQIELLSELGIAILLFLVGIKLDIKLIRSLGPVAVITGLGQVVFTAGFGFLIGLGMGLDPVTALYVAVALTFSSTIIIVKLLSDKREIDALHGQIALGFLIVQDLVVVVAMIVLSTLGIGSQDGNGGMGVVMVLGAGVALVGLVILFVRYVADPLSTRLAQAPELLVIFSIALATMFATLADVIGLGKELGGLLAGVALASTPYRESISARLAPLRDFMLLFFFISLGSTLDMTLLGESLGMALVFSAFVLIGNPLIVLMIMGAIGYRRRTGFLAGLTVAQISEFSLIFISMGLALGHVGEQALGLVTLVGLVTIAVSVYMITYSGVLYDLFGRFLSVFERRTPWREPEGQYSHRDAAIDVIVFGMGRFGTAIALRLQDRGLSVLGVDFNPRAVHRARALGLDADYGDAADPEFVASLPLERVQWAVSTVPRHPTGLSHEDSRHTLAQVIRSNAFSGQLAIASHHSRESGELLEHGADMVLEPFQDAADRAVDLICGAQRSPRTPIPPISPDEAPDESA